MLTIRDTIQLHIGNEILTTGSESFSRRIGSNYDLLQGGYSAKNLLFLLTAPQELPEEEGNMTTLVSQQNETNIQSITMDVVNNVINRIMLDGTSQFTYQDQIYISSVLQKLGISNMEQFMQQVRQLRTENEMTYELGQTYRSEVLRLLTREKQGEGDLPIPIPAASKDENAPQVSDPRVSMSLQILKRLGTSKIYQLIHHLQRNWRAGSNVFRQNEFHISEQLRFSNQVTLAENKQQIYTHSDVHLLHHLNQYETSLLMEAPKSEDEVFMQAAAAALVTAVDQTVVEVLNRPQIRNGSWLHLENAISQTAQQTIARYETYHSQDLLLPQTGDSPLRSAEHHYLQELKDYQLLYQRIYPKAVEYNREIGIPPMTKLLMTHLTHVQENTELTEVIHQPGEIHQDYSKTLLRDIIQNFSQEKRWEAVRSDRKTQLLEHLIRENTVIQKQQMERLHTQHLEKQSESLQVHITNQAPSPEHTSMDSVAPVPTTLLQQNSDSPYEEENTPIIDQTGGNQLVRELVQQIAPSAQQEPYHPMEPVKPAPDASKVPSYHEIPLTPTIHKDSQQYEPESNQESGESPDFVPQKVIRDTVEQIVSSEIILNNSPDETAGFTREEAHSSQNTILTPVTITLKETEKGLSETGRVSSRQEPSLSERMIRETVNQIVPHNLHEPVAPMEPVRPQSAQKAASKEKEIKPVSMEFGESAGDIRETEQVLSAPEGTSQKIMKQTVQQLLSAEVQKKVHEPMKYVTPAQPDVQRGSDLPVPPAPMTLKEAEQQAPEILIEELNRIDQHNRTVLKAVQQQMDKREQPVVYRDPDLRRTMRESLRALENPEAVLQEIWTNPAPVPTEHPDYTPQEEAVLAQADPATREIYERILTYERNPQRAIQEGFLRPANIGALTADLQQAVRPPDKLDLEYAEPLRDGGIPAASGEAEYVMEQFLQKPIASRTVEQVLHSPEAIQLVHKQVSTGISEEMLEELRTERNQTNVQTQTHNQVNQQQSHQVDLNQMEHHVVTQTTEDITELVNRTLSHQMRTISDQVYHQMEKRLKTERTRRGRF